MNRASTVFIMGCWLAKEHTVNGKNDEILPKMLLRLMMIIKKGVPENLLHELANKSYG